ncbi:MAG: hypothetical protein JOZ78_24330 [Chroococcidiopsidaceae cyanobacterium CP_BM_ER_R8_30]|nr:hypothetical protein [Chroococcidiopsidaceae cyanobacterium CP_BM_ER_R8_30]
MTKLKTTVWLGTTGFIVFFPFSIVINQPSAVADDVNPAECPIPISYTRSSTQQQLDQLIASFATDPTTGLYQCQAVSVSVNTILNRYYSTPIPAPVNPSAPSSVNPGQFLTPSQFDNTNDAISQLALASQFGNFANYEESATFLQPTTAYEGIVGPQLDTITGQTLPGGAIQYVVPSNFSFPQDNGIRFTYIETLSVPEPSNILGIIAFFGLGFQIKRNLGKAKI